MELKFGQDIYQAAKSRALVLADDPDIRPLILTRLETAGYAAEPIQALGAEENDFNLNDYSVILCCDLTDNLAYETNRILEKIKALSTEERRNHCVIVVGGDLSTGDEMQAFSLSCDLVVATADLNHLDSILKKEMDRREKLYRSFEQDPDPPDSL